MVERGVYLSDLGCIYLRDISAVVVSDLHLGFEEEMNLHGLFLPKMQLKHVEEKIDKMMERYSPETIIINGDFKQEFSRNLSQEWDDILYFIEKYSSLANLKFIRGNHDNYLITILERKGIDLYEYYESDRYYIYHGDRDLGLKKITMLGHEHPSLVLRDSIGGIVRMNCFAYSESEHVAITPSLSFYSTGTDVSQSLISEEHFTPVLKKVDPGKFRIYGLTDDFGLVDFGYLNDLGN